MTFLYKISMCVMVQFINKDWNLYNITVDFEQVKGSHDVLTLAEALMKVINNLSIGTKAHFITKDSTSVNFSMAEQLEELKSPTSYSHSQHLKATSSALYI